MTTRTPKTDHAAKTANIALQTATAAQVAATAAATAASVQLVHLAHLEERQIAAADKFESFRMEWKDNAGEVREAIKGLAIKIETHEHRDMCARADAIDNEINGEGGLVDRVNDISSGIRKGNIFSGVGIGLVAILASVLAYLKRL